MDDILETKLLEFNKSAYLIVFVRHESGIPYIEITQSIYRDKIYKQKLMINPSVLPEIIAVLKDFQEKINGDFQFSIQMKAKKTHEFISEADKEKIRERYLKGVPIKDLEIQINKPGHLIKQVLHNMNIDVVSNELPKRLRVKKKK